MKTVQTRRFLIALSAAFAAMPATAQSLPLGSAVASPYASSKTEVILGGSSRLAAILAQQSSDVGSTLVVQASVPAPANSGYVVRHAVMPRYAPVSTDRPDVFGSVALSINRSPLDSSWRAIMRRAATGQAATYASRVSTLGALAKLDAINRYVNSRVAYVNDIKLSGVEDRWSSGAETLARGKGDCEDYAIAKLQMLRRAGFAESDLYLVILRDLRRRADHAVLVVRADDRLLVLDNGTDRIVDSAALVDYRPIFTYSGNHVWTHGYRRAEPPIVIAAAEPVGPKVELASAETQQTTVAAAIPAPSANN